MSWKLGPSIGRLRPQKCSLPMLIRNPKSQITDPRVARPASASLLRRLSRPTGGIWTRQALFPVRSSFILPTGQLLVKRAGGLTCLRISSARTSAEFICLLRSNDARYRARHTPGVPRKADGRRAPVAAHRPYGAQGEKSAGRQARVDAGGDATYSNQCVAPWCYRPGTNGPLSTLVHEVR
jgi:hypothetical protein